MFILTLHLQDPPTPQNIVLSRNRTQPQKQRSPCHGSPHQLTIIHISILKSQSSTLPTSNRQPIFQFFYFFPPHFYNQLASFPLKNQHSLWIKRRQVQEQEATSLNCSEKPQTKTRKTKLQVLNNGRLNKYVWSA